MLYSELLKDTRDSCEFIKNDVEVRMRYLQFEAFSSDRIDYSKNYSKLFEAIEKIFNSPNDPEFYEPAMLALMKDMIREKAVGYLRNISNKNLRAITYLNLCEFIWYSGPGEPAAEKMSGWFINQLHKFYEELENEINRGYITRGT